MKTKPLSRRLSTPGAVTPVIAFSVCAVFLGLCVFRLARTRRRGKESAVS